jgi:hypothetical protein
MGEALNPLDMQMRDVDIYMQGTDESPRNP